MKIDIITIGDELLIGQTVDTNSAWIGQQMAMNGIEVRQITSISDKADQIIKTIDESLKYSEAVLITGGLGPTNDDITKHTLCEYFNTELVFHDGAFENVKMFVSRRNTQMNEANRLQAMFPKSAEFVPNLWGTASGILFEKEGRIVVSMPGIPHEMKNIMSEYIIPRLLKMKGGELMLHENVLIKGMSEAVLAETLTEWEAGLKADNISLAYLPSPGCIKLRLSLHGTNSEEIRNTLNEKIETLKTIVPDNFMAKGFENLESFLADELIRRGKTIAFAESCTGGFLSHIFTTMPGSSSYLKGSVIAYSNEVKIKALNVSEEYLNNLGAVSKEVVEQMAANVRSLYSTDYSIAVSGIAGPSGGTEEKPVGTVWVAIASEDNVISEHFCFGNVREFNIKRSAYTGIGMIITNYLQNVKVTH